MFCLFGTAAILYHIAIALSEQPISAVLRFFLILILLLYSVAQAAPRVVVSIKPLHALTASLMQNIGEAELLIDGAYSPHHYQFKPSDIKRLQQADLVVWIGPELESNLRNHLHHVTASTRILTLLELKTLEALPYRDSSEHHQNPIDNRDPHVWLDPQRAQSIADALLAQLLELDPTHASQYKQNHSVLTHKLYALHNTLQRQFKPLQQRAYIVAHDAFQYLEQRYKLKSTGFISTHPDRQPSAKHLLQLQNTLVSEEVVCLFYETHYPKKIIQRFAEDNHLCSQALDDLGYRIDPGPALYFKLMQNLADDMADCLTTKIISQ